MSELFLLLFLSSWTLLLCDDMKNISVTAGQNVNLECRPQVSLNDVIAVLKWKKPEMKRYVFHFRGKHFNGVYQDERFRDRVQLRDPEMKNGDVSVVLRNVTANDSGTYECRVTVKRSGQRRVRRHELEPEHVSIVQLTVTEPGTTDGDTGGHTGGDQGGGDQGLGNMHGAHGLIAVAVIVVIGVIVTGLILVSIRRRKNSDQPAGDDDAEQETLSPTRETHK